MDVSPSSGSLPAAVGSTPSPQTWTALGQNSSCVLLTSQSHVVRPAVAKPENFCSKKRRLPSAGYEFVVTVFEIFLHSQSCCLSCCPSSVRRPPFDCLTAPFLTTPSCETVKPNFSLRENLKKANCLQKVLLPQINPPLSISPKVFPSKEAREKKAKCRQTCHWGTKMASFFLSLSLPLVLSGYLLTSLSSILSLSLSLSLSRSQRKWLCRGGDEGSILLLPSSDHRAEQMQQLHPLVAAQRLTRNSFKKKKRRRNLTLDQFSSSVLLLQRLYTKLRSAKFTFTSFRVKV